MTDVIAHRGASADTRQNTLKAFELAVEMGADWIELDVRRSLDDVLVISHDAHLEDGRIIVEHEYADLPDWLPTLAEALAAAGTVPVNIEIKNEPDDPDYDAEHQISDAVVGLALAFREPEDLLFTSFNLATMQRIKAVNDALTVGLVTGLGVMDIPMLIERLVGAGMDTVAPNAPTVDGRFVDLAHEAGLVVNTWTVNDPDRMRELIDLGVDGLITDVVDIARTVVDEHRLTPSQHVPD